MMDGPFHRTARYVGKDAGPRLAIREGSMASAARGDLHRRLSAFVDWIATEPAREDDLRERADSIRYSIKAKAKDDGLVIRSTPTSGSFATRTGLRRHMRGESEVDGQDVDLPFVVAPETKDEERLEVLLPRFEKYAREAYRDTAKETTKSSVWLKFSDQVNFDLVPLLATTDPERQVLVRSDGERRETSVQKHVYFVKKRTAKSDDDPGRVKFNEMVRLLKWWRCFRLEAGRSLTDIPSFLVNLLAAYAFDHRGVQGSYGETVADWFGFLARAARKRTAIVFNDFASPPVVSAGPAWSVHDPVNAGNNVVEKWTGLMCDEFADWLEESRDAMYDVIAAFDDGRESNGMNGLVLVFGNPIRHHSERDQ